MSKFKQMVTIICLLILLHSNNIFSAGVPTLVHTESIPAGFSVEVIDSENNYLYTGSEVNKVSIVDITDPRNATVVKVVDIDAPTPASGDDSFLALDSNDDYLYVLAGNARATLVAINIKNPLSAFVEDTLTITSFAGQYIAIDSSDKYLYVYGSESLDVIDISNPTNLTLETTVPYDTSSGFLSNIIIDSQEKYLYAFERTGTAKITLNVMVIDISDPPTASLKKRLTLGSFAGVSVGTPNYMRLDSTDSYLYVTNNQNKELMTIDVSNPLNPSITDSIDTTFTINNLISDVPDTFLYAAVAGSPGKVLIYELSDPANPQEISTLSAPTASPTWLVLDPSDTNLYVIVNGEAKLYVYDVSTPSTPVELTNIDLTNPALAVIDSVGAFLYVLGGVFSDLFVIFNPDLPPINGLTCSSRVVNYPPKDRINVLKWGPADTQGAVYLIKRNGVLIAAPLQNKLVYEDHNRPKGTTDTYSVVGANSLGQTTPESICSVQVAN